VQRIIVNVYKKDPTVAQIAERLVDLDEGFMEWRYRHVKMVQRTIGTKAGPADLPEPSTCSRPSISRRSRPLGHPRRVVIDPQQLAKHYSAFASLSGSC